MLIFGLLKGQIQIRALAIVILAGKVNSKFCNGGHICSPPKECCPLGCCLVFVSPEYRPTMSHNSESSPMSNFLPWNHWVLWSLFALLLLTLFCGCGLWKKRQMFANRLLRRSNSTRNDEDRSEFDSTGSCYPPPQYSRCSSLQYAPPPYNEVTSKPDLYPLVISYKTDNGKFGDNCVVVQYSKNYVIHPAVAGSTINSLGSNLYAQTVNELDSNYPPSYEELRIRERNQNGNQNDAAIEISHQYLSQREIIRNNNGDGYQNAEGPRIIKYNTQQSILKQSNETFKINMLPAAVKKIRPLQNSAQSLPCNLYNRPLANPKNVSRPCNLNLKTFQVVHKGNAFSPSPDSINGTFTSHAHHYSSDVILAQPQSYCEPTSDLHYYSSDILNNMSNFLQCVNDSYSSEDNLSQARGSLQDFVSSDGLSHSQLSNLETNNFSTSSEVSSLQGCGSPDSPPRATSPTGEFRHLLEKIQQLPTRKDLNKPPEKNSADFFHYYNLRNLNDIQVQSCEENIENSVKLNEDLVENELSENCHLINKTQNSNLNSTKLIIRPNKLIRKPSRSKTFYMFLSQSSLNLKKNNLKSSSSAPVTPATHLPSPVFSTFNFANSSKFGSKKNLGINADGMPLLPNQEDEEANENR